VDGNRVRGDVVHALKDVEFALVGPVGQTCLPDGGPGSAALRHVSHIEAVDGEDVYQGLIRFDRGLERRT